MTFTIDQNMVFTAIFISIILDVFIRPFLKIQNKEFRQMATRLILIGISMLAMFILNKETYIQDGIVSAVMSMLFYDVAGYKLIRKKLKTRLSDEVNINLKDE